MNIATGLYALFLLIGGVSAYIKVNSNPSLIMGSISALVFFILAFQKGRIADSATLVLSAFMMMFFGYRLYLTQQFFPAGIIACASLALFVFHFLSGRCNKACTSSD